MPTMMTKLSAVVLFPLFLFTSWVNGSELHKTELNVLPFSAEYELFRQGEKYGGGKRILQRLDNNQFSIELSSSLEWLIFSDRRTERSKFKMVDKGIQPIEYYYNRKGTGKDKSLVVNFHDDTSLSMTPTPKKNTLTNWQSGWLDEMTLHVQLQQELIAGKTQFEYNIISKSGKLRNYKMEVIGQEIITTGLGRFNAIKVARIYEKGKHSVLNAWFIPELNYTLARLWRMKKGVEQYDLVISGYQQK